MGLYQLAILDGAAAQSIPDGFDGFFDWPVVDDIEKARRGWVRYEPPFFDPLHERVETAFSQDADDIWRAAYIVVPGPVAPALAAAMVSAASRRWDEQTRGITVPIAGVPTRFLSTKEGQTDIGNALQLAAAAETSSGTGSFAMTWKSLDGFVTVKLADLVAVGMAIGAHVAACFGREGRIVAALDTAASAEDANAYAIRDLLAAEIDKGWPA